MALKWKSDLDLEHSLGEDFYSKLIIALKGVVNLMSSSERWSDKLKTEQKSKSTSKQKKKQSKETKLSKDDQKEK